MLNRRSWLKFVALAGLMPKMTLADAAKSKILQRSIPSSGERIPAIGMGSWLTFDIGDSQRELGVRVNVLKAFFEQGGGLVDSSPMYGSSQHTIGRCLRELSPANNLFSATKVWTPLRRLGIKQIEQSETLWGRSRFDLLQVHNMLSWKAHLETLKAWKEEDRVRYIGVTTSHGRRHDELAHIMRREPIDFVQLTYNLTDNVAERLLLPLAEERGIAVIVNRPFRRGQLFGRVRNKPLPPWAHDFGCENWAQIFLKYIISHSAVTCAIPATSRVDHMMENMGALRGEMLDADQRRTIALHYRSL